MSDQSAQLQRQILSACKNNTALRIEGANSKHFLGNPSEGDIISTLDHRGIIHYDPSELVITARSGTPLMEIRQTLAEHHQMLAFEPPAYDHGCDQPATLGGTIACNLSGPARPYAGAARDFVLGCTLINGKGERLQFGGQVIKNVAGYDASRLMAGAYGTLGLLLEVSLKVIPIPHSETTLRFAASPGQAIETMNRLAGQALPLSASCYFDGHVAIRLSSSEKNTAAASKRLSQTFNASPLDDSAAFWQEIREQRHAFFNTTQTLWRLSMPCTGQPLTFEGEQLLEWGGACRWLKTDMDAASVREGVRAAGGHATAYRNRPPGTDCFQPLDERLMILQQGLKKAFDPAGILNPGRLYPAL